MKRTFTTLLNTSILVYLVRFTEAVVSIPPPARWGSSCIGLGNSVYCYGGDSRSSGVDTALSDLWELSAANDFDLSNPPWSNISMKTDFQPTPTAFGVMAPLTDGMSLLINGGVTSFLNASEANQTQTNVYVEVNQTTVYNTVTREWTSINSSIIAQTRKHQAVIDANGKVWCFGGLSDPQTGRNNVSYWEGLAALNTITWQWTTSRGTTGNYLNPRVGHSMTILPNGFIYIMGGYVANLNPGLDANGYLQWALSFASMGNVAVYDTVKGTWTSIITSGTIPPPRAQHSAVLAGDGSTIIVFGGTGSDDGASLYNDLYAFNSSTAAWIRINIILNGPTARYGHNAVMINETMFVLFGLDATNTTMMDIHALDTINWQWTTHFSASGYQQQANGTYPPAISSPASPTQSSTAGGAGNSSFGGGPIAGVVVGCIAALGAIATIAFCIRRRKRLRGETELHALRRISATNAKSDLLSHTQRDENNGYSTPARPSSMHRASQDAGSFHGSGIFQGTEVQYLPKYTKDSTFISKPDERDVPTYSLRIKPDENDDGADDHHGV